MEEKAKAVKEERAKQTERIEKARTFGRTFEDAKSEMAHHSSKKAHAGFLKSLWLEISGPSHDLTKMETDLAFFEHRAKTARELLPHLQLQEEQASSQIRMIDQNLLITGREIGGAQWITQRELWSGHLSLQTDAQAERWSADLEFALLVERAGALRWLHALKAYQEIEQAGVLLKECASRRGASAQALGQANEGLRKDSETLLGLEDTAPRLLALAERLGISVPTCFPHCSLSENEAFFSKLTVSRDTISEKLQRWPDVKAALERYRARLAHASVDLRRVVLLEANVVGATCSGIAGAQEFDGDFDCVVLDEAGRTTALDILMPMVRGRSVVLVGDHKQLPPFLGQAARQDLDKEDLRLAEKSIFEQVFETAHPDRVEVLRKQYRMAPPICDIVGRISYTEPSLRIETAGPALGRDRGLANMRAVHWIRPTGNANTAKADPSGGLLNQAEVAAAVAALERIAQALPAKLPDQEPFSIGVIAMYKRQAQALERTLTAFRKTHPDLSLEVGTVDSFQGREKDAVLVSFAETDPSRKRFFYDRRRLNVALSRARELLILIGSLDTLGAAPRCFGEDNPLFELRTLLDAGQGVSTSKETFHA